MSTSGSSNFSVNCSEIVTAAFEEIRVLATGETLDSADMSYGKKKLNLLIKNIMGPNNYMYRGLKVWQRARTSLTLTAKRSFSLKLTGGDCNIDPPIDIISITRKTAGGEETPLTPMTVRKNHEIENKTSVATPTRYFYERELDEGKLYFDFVPSDITDTMEILYLRPLEDFDSSANDIDFPQHWHLPLLYMLAIDLCGPYDRNIPDGLIKKFDIALTNANDFYPEEAEDDDYFQPGLE